MPVSVFTHQDCLLHDPGPGHPERPDRLRAILKALGSEPAAVLRDAPVAPLDLIESIHSGEYLDLLRATAAQGGGALDPDTTMSAASWNAALRSAGGAVAAVEHALGGAGNAFSAGRPPGHHALRDRAMGFCLLGNAVIAARAAQRAGIARALIVDWDVHHGNGTQALVEHDASIRFVSLHQFPWWPGTGAAAERGVGNIFNVPRAPGLAPERYVEDLWTAIGGATRGWAPGVVVISAGFDAMRGDPLGGFTLEAEHYAELTTRLRDHLPGAPLVGVLEGGYIPDRLAAGVAAFIRAMA
ncbi:MAG TPA: histone deacetylase [Gemmatimonadales bacterium]|nr:histone deacetylase [Gemmatimonadales bacterium]